MRKIKKYQFGADFNQSVPSYGLNRGTLSEQFIGTTNNDWLKKLNKPVSNNLLPSGIAKTLNTQIQTPKFSGLASGLNKGSGSLLSNITGSKGGGVGSILGSVGGAVTGLAEGILGVAGVKKATINDGTSGILNTIGDSLSSLGTVGSIAGTAIKALNLINQYGGRSLKKQGTDANLDTGGYARQINPQAGGKTTLFTIGRKNKIDAQTKRADTANLLAANVTYRNKQNQIAAANTYGDIASKTQQQLSGGLRTNVLAVKKGAKISPQYLSKIVTKAKKKVKKLQEGNPTDDLQKMSLGGEIPNVIPEGALHARKNNYEGELGEQVTSKGIPVITIEEGGEITQHAEIEHSEIIFNKKVSTQLEDWFKEYNKTEDESKKKSLELECGKLLTYEILENTEDNTNLIEQV